MITTILDLYLHRGKTRQNEICHKPGLLITLHIIHNHISFCLTSNSMAALYTMGGLEKFYYEFNEPLYHMMHVKGYRNYAFVVEGKTQQVRFRLFGSGKAGEK